ncbi:MAG: glycosyltransferase [Legionellaceae bacterium]|nr:glycosyltransferase [Legionellaceae bacterium]
MNNFLKALIRCLIDIPWAVLALVFLPLNLLVFFIVKLAGCLGQAAARRQPKLLFGVTPIISIAYMARALKARGYVSDTAVLVESPIYPRDTFDKVLSPHGNYPKIIKLCLGNLMAYCFFMRALWKYDVFHYYFDGGLLRHTLFSRLELAILKLCRKKIVLLPYGSDAFVYDLIPNVLWRHGLMIEYSRFGNTAATLQKRMRRMTASADIVIACLVHCINLPRWDILPLTCYPVDTERFEPLYPETKKSSPIRIAHACNHRGVKGTVFLIDAVKRLEKAGFDVQLDIIEAVPNDEALVRIKACDIYVDQLIFGYAQAALEGLAFGKIVISALDNSPEYDLFRRFSYLNECPIVSANPDTIYEVLIELIEKRKNWDSMGQASRAFVEHRHSYTATADMFEAIYQKIYFKHQDVDLINFYHPLLENQS